MDRTKEVRNKIKLETSITTEQLDNIIQIFWNIDTYEYLLISDKYLELLIAYIKEYGADNFVRFDFYEYCIKSITKDLDKENIQLLQNLATTMELMQVNELSKKDLHKFSSKISTKAIKTDITKFLEATNENKDLLKFDHHTIQEYLASQNILKNNNPLEYFNTLATIEIDNLKYLKPSWYGVLRFLLESDRNSEFINYIFELYESNENLIDEQLANTLCTVDPSKVSEYLSQIFEVVFQTYQRKRNWTPIWAGFNLWKFIDKDQLNHFKVEIDQKLETDTALFVIRGNIVRVLKTILKNNPALLDEDDKLFWKDKFIEFANYNEPYGVLQRESLSALSYFKDKSVIEKVKECFNSEETDKLIKEAFIEMCSDIDPESENTMEYIAKGLKNNLSFKSRYAIYKIKTKEGISRLLNKFIEDSDFLEEFLQDESIFSKEDDETGDSQLLKTIQSHINSATILKNLKDLITSAFTNPNTWSAQNSKFLQKIAQLILSKEPYYPFELLAQSGTTDEEKIELHHLERLLGSILTLENFDKFVNQFKKTFQRKDDWMLRFIIFYAKDNKYNNSTEFIDYATRKGLVKQEDTSKETIDIQKEDKAKYVQFKKYLEPETGKYSPAVFEYFNNNEETIRKLGEKEDISRLKDLVINTGLAKADTRNIIFEFVRDSEGRKTGSHTITNFVSFLGDILRTAQILCTEEEILKYKQTIIDFVPYAYSEDVVTLNEIIKDVTEQELEFINSLYLNKESAARYYLPDSYINFLTQYLENDFYSAFILKVLQSFVEDDSPDLDIYVRRSAMEKIYQFQKDIDKSWVQTIFNKYSEAKDEKLKLAEYANKILVEKFQDQNGIEWLLMQLKNRINPFDKIRDFHKVSDFESELRDQNFGISITKVNDDSIFNKLMDLLEDVQKLEDDDTEYSAYSNYVWRIIKAYIQNKDSDKSNELIEITKEYLKNNVHKNTNWMLAELEINFDKFKLTGEKLDSAIDLVVKNQLNAK